MCQRIIFFVALIVFAGDALSQIPASRVSQYVDLTGTIGKSQGTVAGSFVHNWKLGARNKIEVGIGGRITSYFGSKKDFVTAGPARYTRTFTTPFIIFFAGQEEQNFDTLALQRPLTVSTSVMLNLGYAINPKWYAGFNIDLIGFTFGRKSSSVFISDGTTRIDPSTKPTTFNLLLTGDHDLGSLNSEFYIRYRFAPHWSLKALYQFVFIEYETTSITQMFSDGTMNDRFRNKANNVGLGVSYFLK